VEWVQLDYVGHGDWVAGVEWQVQQKRVAFLKRHLRKR
jgi:hypothetical protein